MAEPELAEEGLQAHRKSRAKHLAVVTKLRNRLQAMLEEDPAELDPSQLQDTHEFLATAERRWSRNNDALMRDETDAGLLEADDTAWDAFQETLRRGRNVCKRLMDLRTACGLIQTLDVEMTSLKDLMASDPTRDHTDNLQECSDLSKELQTTLRSSTIPSGHRLMSRASDLKRRLQELRSKEGTPTVSDSKDSLRAGKPKGPYKLPKVNLPTFNGELKNWHHFWVQFKDAVHTNPTQTSWST